LVAAWKLAHPERRIIIEAKVHKPKAFIVPPHHARQSIIRL
jgi:hypothetical protein